MIRPRPSHRLTHPADPSVASCSPPSRTLRAAAGGGLRPSLTATARAAQRRSGRDEKTALQPNQKTAKPTPMTRTTHPLQKADIFTRHGQLTPHWLTLLSLGCGAEAYSYRRASTGLDRAA